MVVPGDVVGRHEFLDRARGHRIRINHATEWPRHGMAWLGYRRSPLASDFPEAQQIPGPPISKIVTRDVPVPFPT